MTIFRYAPQCITSIFLMLISITALGEPGVLKKEILIGESIGLTGVASEQAQDHVAGYNLYFNKTNAAGGINGRKIRVIAYDDAYDPMRTVANVNKLIFDDNVFMLFKIYGTPTIKAILPLINANDIPVLCPSSGAEFIRNPINKNIFHLKRGYYYEAKGIVEFLVKKRNLKKIAIFYQDDSFGNEGRTGTKKALAAYNLEPVVDVKYKKAAEEFASEFKTIVNAKPDAVILWSLTASGIQFAQIAKKQNLKAVIVGNSSMATAEFAREGEGIFLTLPVPSPETKGIQIIDEFREDAKKAKISINPTTLQAYLDGALLVKALKDAGKNPTRVSFRSALENMAKISLGGLDIDFSPTDHEGLTDVFLSHISGGKFVQVP